MKKNIKEYIGKLLFDERKKRKLTMMQVGDAIGLTKSAIHYIERGKGITIENFGTLLDYYGLAFKIVSTQRGARIDCGDCSITMQPLSLDYVGMAQNIPIRLGNNMFRTLYDCLYDIEMTSMGTGVFLCNMSQLTQVAEAGIAHMEATPSIKSHALKDEDFDAFKEWLTTLAMEGRKHPDGIFVIDK